MAEQISPPSNVTPVYENPSDLKSRMKASYDAIALKYNEWTVPHSTTKIRYLDQLLERLPTNSPTPVSVLEIGCGAGLPVTQKLLSYPKFSVTANDISSSQLALARASLQPDRLTLIEGDMLALDLPPGSLDAVVGMYSIIHLPLAEQVEMLSKVVAWLKPGGWLLANFGVEKFAGREVKNWLKEEEGWMFWSGWGSEGTLEKVREAGLEIIVQDTVVDEDEVDVKFLWILARKNAS